MKYLMDGACQKGVPVSFDEIEEAADQILTFFEENDWTTAPDVKITYLKDKNKPVLKGCIVLLGMFAEAVGPPIK